MPKAVPKNRFRSRKINYKTRIVVRIGNLDYGEEAIDYADLGERQGDEDSHPRDRKVDTGVDKEEEHELHLQNVIKESAARFKGRSGHGRSGSSSKAALAHIPTPNATGLAENYDALYKLRPAYVEPSTYIRFSDTVEDCIGVAYTMDEDDEYWLNKFNARIVDRMDKSEQNSKSTSAKKDTASEIFAEQLPTTIVSEDDFEMIMNHFEATAEERYPLLHADLSRMPSFADFEDAFNGSSDNPRLAHLKIAAQSVYLHWVDRRSRVTGQGIMPQLDYDESKGDNPYICFRRREPKNVRKTRRTDAQNLDRLIRLSTDLSAAKDLMIRVLERERCKREALLEEHSVFEGRVQLRELKRKLGERDGDENLLIGKREKRRKPAEEIPQTTSLKVPLRISRPDLANTVPAVLPIAEPCQLYKDRTASILQRIDRDLNKKKEADRDWEDWTDGAYLPAHLAIPARYWRAPEYISIIGADGTYREQASQFGPAYPYALGGVRPSYRRRTGRSNRVFLDRILTEEQLDGEDEILDEETLDRRRRLRDRWRFDSDSTDLPGADSVQIMDDFEAKYQVARLDLLRVGDIASLKPSNAFLDEARRWIAREPEKRPATTVVGKLPIKPAPVQSQQVQASQALPAPPVGAAPQNSQNQMQAAANHAHLMTAATQAQLKRTSGSPLIGAATNPAPNGVPTSRRAPSVGSPGAPTGMNIGNTAAQQAALAQWQSMNGMQAGTKLDPALLQTFQAQLQQQQQTSPILSNLHLPNRQLVPSNANSFPNLLGSANGVHSPGLANFPNAAAAARMGAQFQPIVSSPLVNPLSNGALTDNMAGTTQQLQETLNGPALRSRRSPQLVGNALKAGFPAANGTHHGSPFSPQGATPLSASAAT